MLSAWITFAPVMLRERKMPSGISGFRAVASRQMNAASSASEIAAEQQRLGIGPSRSRPPA